jgi:hypothetical protein
MLVSPENISFAEAIFWACIAHKFPSCFDGFNNQAVNVPNSSTD